MSTPVLLTLENAQRALESLPPSPSPGLRAALRALDRAADDAEAAISELPSSAASSLARAVATAREGSASARSGARRAAREEVAAGRRAELLGGADGVELGGSEEGAAKVAEDITAGLRRVTGIVQEEIGRTVATGGAVDDSSRVLGKTRDVHKGYGEGLASGEETLDVLWREERRANLVLGLSLLLFVLVAGHILVSRIANSNTATFIVSPVYRVATFVPRRFLRLSRALVGAAFGGAGGLGKRPVSSPRNPQPVGLVGGEKERGREHKPPDAASTVDGRDDARKDAENAVEDEAELPKEIGGRGASGAREAEVMEENVETEEILSHAEEKETAEIGSAGRRDPDDLESNRVKLTVEHGEVSHLTFPEADGNDGEKGRNGDEDGNWGGAGDSESEVIGAKDEL